MYYECVESLYTAVISVMWNLTLIYKTQSSLTVENGLRLEVWLRLRKIQDD